MILVMDTLLSQYQTELERTDADLLEAEKEFRAISERKGDLTMDKQALQQLISSRKKKLGIPEKTAVQAVPSKAEEKKPEPQPGKSAFVRELLRAKAGMTPAEIRKAAEGKFDLKKNFPYTILYGWKEAGKAEEKGGKYYLKD